jgi:hypothetical protein
MSLGLVMELILAIAIGLGLSRATMGYWGYLLWYGWSLTAAASFFAGVALAFGPKTWLEAARRRERVAWGMGRQIWSTVAIYYLLTNVIEAARMFIQTWLRGPGPGWVLRCVNYLLQTNTNDFFGPVAIGIVSFGITRWISRDRSGPPPDAREWTLRVAAALLVVTFFGLRIAILASG